MKNQLIYQISDCHLNTEDAQAEHSLIFVLNQIENSRTADDCYQEGEQDNDILLITGDLVCSPTFELYVAFKRIIETHCSFKRIFAIAGNHDQRELMAIAFADSHIQVTHQLNLGKQCQLLFVDSSDKPLSGMALGSGRVAQRGLEAIKKNTRKKPSLVIIHHPIVNLGAEWFQKIGIENHLAVRRAIHPQSIAVVSGHAHGYFKHALTPNRLTENEPDQTQLHQIVCPATCYGFDHKQADYKRTSTIGYIEYHLSQVDREPKLEHAVHQFNAESCI
ncbi:metallophosphoesterase [Vibrio makurazakiensis]